MRCRPLLALALAALWLLPRPGSALRADTGGTGGTTGTDSSTALAASDFTYEFWYKDKRTDRDWKRIADSDLVQFFNRARCECDTPVMLRVRLIQAAKTKVSRPAPGILKVGAGDSGCACASNECVSTKCKYFGGERNLSALANEGLDFETTVLELFQAGEANTDPSVACRRRNKENIYLLPEGDDSDEFPDVTNASKEIELDGQAPPMPSDIKVVAGNGALEVSWSPIPTTEVDDLQGYAIFCARGNELPPFPGHFTRSHDTPANLCSATAARVLETSAVSQRLEVSDAGAPDAGPTDSGAVDSTASDSGSSDLGSGPPQSSLDEAVRVNDPAQGLRILDPDFLCSDLMTTATSARIKGLENMVPYVVTVAAVDRRGNASIIDHGWKLSPKPTRDFFRDYRASGGDAGGGFCALGRGPLTGGTAGWSLMAAVVAIAMIRRRFRRQGGQR